MKIYNLMIAGTLTVTGLFVCDSSQASTRNQRIRRTEARQVHRINQGVRSGQLTHEEAKELRKDQRAIRQERKEAKRDDGVIDNQERREIRKDQAETSKEIYQEKHDSETQAPK